MKKTFLFCWLLLGSIRLTAQSVELGVAGGVFLYSGDLSYREFGIYLDNPRPAFGVFGRVALTPWLSARLALNTGRLEVDDARNRGYNFRTRLTEAALLGEFHLFYLGRPEAALRVAPYLAAGAGLFRFSPEGRLDNQWIPLQPLGTEGQGLPGYDAPYSLTRLQFPIGLGVKFTVNQRLTFGLEFAGRQTLTDYLDDVGNTSVNFRDVVTGNGLTAARFSNPSLDPEGNLDVVYRRGGPFNDWYYFFNVQVSVHLGGGGGGRNASRDSGCYQF